MIVIGLTGGVGMGKSSVAKMLQDLGIPAYSADEAVHVVLGKGGCAVARVAKAFPETMKRGKIDRTLLGCAVFGDSEKLRRLEKIIHPLIAKAERAFLREARRAKAPAALLEIPLLFETKAERRCDLTLCVSAPRAVQKARVLKRPGMDMKKLRALLARQMPNAEKCKKADYVIPTGVSLAETKKHVRKLIERLGLMKTPRGSSKRPQGGRGRSMSRKPSALPQG